MLFGSPEAVSFDLYNFLYNFRGFSNSVGAYLYKDLSREEYLRTDLRNIKSYIIKYRLRCDRNDIFPHFCFSTFL